MSGPLPKPKLRGGLIAGAFGAVIIVGSLTGAQLKSDHQKTEVRSHTHTPHYYSKHPFSNVHLFSYSRLSTFELIRPRSK